MDLRTCVLPKVCELTAFVAITALPALATVFAIVVTFARQMLRQSAKEARELGERRKELLKQFDVKVKEMQADEISPPEKLARLKSEWETSETELKSRAEAITRREARLSMREFLLLPGMMLLASIVHDCIALVLLSLRGSWALLAVLPYVLSVTLIAVAFTCVIRAVGEVNLLARRPDSEERDALAVLTEKMTELLGIKEANFDVSLMIGDNRIDRLELTLGQGLAVGVRLMSHSDYAVEDCGLDMAAPEWIEFKAERGEVAKRIMSVHTYPGGHQARWSIGTLKVRSVYVRNVTLTAAKLGSTVIYVWVNSTSHKRYQKKFSVTVSPPPEPATDDAK